MTKHKNNLFFHNYLKSEKIDLDNEEFNFQLETHPEYPTLLAYHDALIFFNIPNITVRIDDKDISNLPDYFIAEVKSKLAFIKRENNNFNVDIGDGETRNISTEKFQDIWSGVVLAAENEYEQIKKTKINTNFLIGCFSVLLALAISPFSIFLSIFSFLIISGLFFSIESVKQDFNIKSSLSDKLCNISTETNCNAIISSKSFKLFNYLGLTDISIIFFIGQLLNVFIFLLLGFEKQYFVFSLAVLYLSTPIMLASIYYQWKIAKKWCVICLMIIIVLIVQLIFCQFYSKEISLLDYNFINKPIILFFLSFLIPLTGWLFIKPLITSYLDLKIENKKLFKFKRNYIFFKNTLISERKVGYQNLQSDLFIGNKDAKLGITIVTNPLCKYCKDTHIVITDLLKKYSDKIRINLFFNYNPKNEDEDLKSENIEKLHLKLVDIYFDKNQELFLEALGDWFMNKDYDKWFNKYGNTLNSKEDYINILKNQHQQNRSNKIQFTPSIFIGEFSYPSIYDKKDILLYFNDLLEDPEILV